MAILLFVGVDKSGKTTLFKEVLKRTNRHICVDRFAPCHSIYGEYHERFDTPSKGQLYEMEKYLKDSPIPFIYVFVMANVGMIFDRFIQHDEKHIKTDDIATIQNSYIQYMFNTPLQSILVDTSKHTIDECASQIIKEANQIERDKKVGF